jgi:DNA-binding NarL/FixJ family response regulator
VSWQTNREIAAATGTDEQEASRQVSRIFEAIGVTSRSGAAAAALREGIV